MAVPEDDEHEGGTPDLDGDVGPGKAEASIAERLGTEADMIRLTSIAPTSISRTGSVSGSNQLVIQLVYIQADHTATSRRKVWTAPRSVRCSSR